MLFCCKPMAVREFAQFLHENSIPAMEKKKNCVIIKVIVFYKGEIYGQQNANKSSASCR